MAVDLAVSSKRNRTRSPSYPYLDLAAALEKAAVLWRAEGRHAVPVSLAMQHWGYKEESSTGYSCVAALKKFGLVDHEGMGETRQVRLSGLALGILLDKDPGSADRRDALRRAALGPRIHAELWERYGAELPSDQSLKRFLIVDRAFNEAAVDELLEEYKQTMTFAGLGVGTGRGAAAPMTAATLTPAPVAAPLPAFRRSEPDTPADTGFDPGAYEPPRRQEPPPAAARMPARAAGASGLAWNSAPAPAPASGLPSVSPRPAAESHQSAPRQPSLFGGGIDEEDDFDGAPLAEETLAPVRASRAGQEGREDGPWSMARRELPVPLDNDLVARVPYPMTEEDFALLMDTLQLWKKRLVRPRR